MNKRSRPHSLIRLDVSDARRLRRSRNKQAPVEALLENAVVPTPSSTLIASL
jgi:hypothetical protein